MGGGRPLSLQRGSYVEAERPGHPGHKFKSVAEDNWWTECGKMAGCIDEQELKEVWFGYATLDERTRRKNKG